MSDIQGRDSRSLTIEKGSVMASVETANVEKFHHEITREKIGDSHLQDTYLKESRELTRELHVTRSHALIEE